jgi:ABC-2 type transport system ATP-binding protein
MAAVVTASGLCRSYGSFDALKDVSFELEGPGLFGVLGPNGAGKTTLLDLLEGLSSPTRGSVRLFGELVTPKKYPRTRVGVVLQREFVPDQMTTAEYAELFAAIFGVSGGAARILQRARLSARARQRVSQLSGGEAQRLFIAAALVHDPELVFLDEPTAELDPENRRELGAMLRALGRERTVLMTTHDLAEAEALCDYCLFVMAGTIKAAGTRAELVERTPDGKSLTDAFFHFCAARVTRAGDVE